MWAVLYARVRQVDGVSWRNLALTRTPLQQSSSIFNEGSAAVLFGETEIDTGSVHQLLSKVGHPDDAPLTVLAVELFCDSFE